MSRESKIFTSKSNFGLQEEIKHFESFGWELLSVNGSSVTMTRETQNPVYSELVKYEAEYADLVNKLNDLEAHKQQAHFRFKKFLGLLILLIFPAVLYTVNYFKKKAAYEATGLEIIEVKKQIEEVCNTSRITFFQKQA